MTPVLPTDQDIPGRGGINVLVGPNGAGKSRLLSQLARTYVKAGAHVIAIGNTVHDKFLPVKGNFDHLSAKFRRRLPEYAIKSALLRASSESISRLKVIPQVLRYCNMDTRIGFHVRKFRAEALPVLDSTLGQDGRISRDEFLEIESALYRYNSEMRHSNGKIWVEFDDSSFLSISRAVYARLMKWEPTLRRHGVLERVEISLSREGLEIPLLQASSGELSLISTMAYLAAVATRGCVIMVDEPENSLHPSWQREYITQMLDLLHYWRPSLIMATHSPMILSGVVAKGEDVNIIRVEDTVMTYLNARGSNVETMLWDAFETISPQSRFVSIHVVEILNRLAEHEIDLDYARFELNSMKNVSYDSRQKNAIALAIRMANKIAKGKDMTNE